jgi:hypothetical protein
MIAFVARTPLKLVLVDRWRHRWLRRTVLAAWTAAVEIALLAALLTYAALNADFGLWLPLAVALPLIVLELWYDMRSKSRRLVPELAGSVGIGAVAAAIALAGRTPDRVAVRVAARRAVLIGIEQTLHGIAVIGTTALAIQFG